MTDFIANYRRVLNDAGEWQGNQVQFRCPFPACATSRSRKFRVDPERGFWMCFRCRQPVPGKIYRSEAVYAAGGTAEEFALLMGDDPGLWPKVAVDGTETARTGGKKASAAVRKLWTRLFAECALAPEDEARLARRGVDARAAGFVSVVSDVLQALKAELGEDLLYEAGLLYAAESGHLRPRTCVQPGRILIPYFNEKREVEYFVGYQRVSEPFTTESAAEYEVRQGRWVKVAGPAGFTPLLYGAVPAGCEYLFVTEGQIKALAAQQRELPMIGLQGMGNGHQLLLKAVQRAGVTHVVTVFDSSLTAQAEVEEEEFRLARTLIKGGIKNARLRLPLDPAVDGGRKMDVDAYLAGHTPLDFLQLAMAKLEPLEFLPKPPEEAAAPEGAAGPAAA